MSDEGPKKRRYPIGACMARVLYILLMTLEDQRKAIGLATLRIGDGEGNVTIGETA